MRYILTLVSAFFIQVSFSQAFINGNFENNSANTIDQINLSNDALNAMLPGVTAFGSYGDVDIIKSATYGGSGAQDKMWYIALTGGGTDIVALTLTTPLVAGKTYSISFYDRKTNGYAANPIQIGLSETNTNFGTIIYTSPDAPTDNVWTQRTFTFTAQHKGQYITVQMPGGGISEWVNVDNFVFNNTKCGGALIIQASETTITKGSSVSFTVSGGTSYTWNNSETLSTSFGNSVIATPLVTTIYTVSSIQTGCPTLTETLAITVKEPILKDTVVAKTVAPKDTPEVKQQHLKFNRRKLNGRKLLIQETVNVTESTIKLLVWDKNRVDGDVVSIYVNGQLIKENLEVTGTKKEITIHLQMGSNFIVMEAINLGRVPPNTAAISINNGTKHKLTTLISDLKKSGTVEVLYNPDAVAVR